MQSLLYTSVSLLPRATADDVVAAIVERARHHNREHGITGALAFTGTQFAQVIEGEEQTLDKLMARIAVDARHTDVRVIDRLTIAARAYSGWSLAFHGPAHYVQKHIAAAMAPTSDEVAARDLRRLFRHLDSVGGVRQPS